MAWLSAVTSRNQYNTQTSEKTRQLTSPLDEERVDVHECGEDLEGKVEARFVAVQRDHHGSLERSVREATLAPLQAAVVEVDVEQRVEGILKRTIN